MPTEHKLFNGITNTNKASFLLIPKTTYYTILNIIFN